MVFKVTVRSSGHAFTVDDGETILAAALRQSIALPYGCKNGACGSCKSAVVEGSLVQGAHSASALTPAEAAAGKALLCCARPESDLVIEARELQGMGEFPVRKMPARIASLQRVAPDVTLLGLQLPAAERLQYRAGQYLDILLRDGARRSYSIATPPHADEVLQLHVRHLPGGRFTDALFGVAGEGQPALKERDILRCEGPLGTFTLREDSERPIVLLASGTGFAPIKAVAEHLFHARINRGEGERRARPVVLYWGGRRPQDLYMDALPRAWAAQQPNFRYVPVISDALPEDAWAGRTGLVHRAVLEDLPDLAVHEVYACGSPLMVDAARRDFTALGGLPDDRFFADAFTSEADRARDAA
ncbi:MAG TPA: CDP-6-deoxy-delta-3,4-glucoseen reductase [Burkholderiaceae bacterium]|nr:CDP-6-deoxy-delta-3,4-glucoseen reductase [Burkholderiaceae bacterium]